MTPEQYRLRQRRKWESWKRLPGNREKLVKLFKQTGECCQICKKPLRLAKSGETGNPPDVATFDHIVQLSRGGSRGVKNLRVLCFSCNATQAWVENTVRDIITQVFQNEWVEIAKRKLPGFVPEVS